MDINIKVAGLNCMGCVTALEAKLNTTEGIERADIDLPTNTVRISYNDNLISIAEIKRAIVDTGYKVLA